MTTVDGQNTTFLDAARSAGYAKDTDDVSSVFLRKGFYSSFVELHIEQGPILEEEGRFRPRQASSPIIIQQKFNFVPEREK